MKKLFTLFAVVLFSLGAMADWSLSYKKGAEGAWTYNVAPAEDGSVYVNLDANSTYYIYAIIDGNGYASIDASMTEGNCYNFNLGRYDNAQYTQLHINTTRAGEYVFTLKYFAQGQHITATYPDCSEYVNYEYGDNQPQTTWETLANGTVRITLLDAPNVTNVTYRNGGFEGGIEAWTVLSGDNFETSEPAENYFTRHEVSSTVFELRRKESAVLPTPCKIKFATSALAWSCNENNGAWGYPTFEYTYGTLPVYYYAPTNVAVDANGTITFDATAYNYDDATDTYEARIYKDGVLLKAQDVVSGDQLYYAPFETGTYSVKVIAFSGERCSKESEAFDWNLTAGQTFGESIYCDNLWNTTDNGGHPIIMSWTTRADGNIEITIAPNGDEGEGATIFRGAGMNIANFKVNGNDAATYFSSTTCLGNRLILNLKNSNNKPFGATISYNGTVEYQTGTYTNAWPTLREEFIYGYKCPEKPVDPNANLALFKPAQAGIHQDANVASRANDGNKNNFWTSFGQGEAQDWWWSVDLEAVYVVNQVNILFNDHSGNYTLKYSVDGIIWEDYASTFTAEENDSKWEKHFSNKVVARYFKFISSAANVGIKEFEVYGSGKAFVANVTPDGYATYYNGTEAVKTYPAATAYVGELDGNTLNLNAINQDGVIPAGTAVVLKAPAGTTKLAFAPVASTDAFSAANDLQGSDEAIETSSVEGTVMVLGYKNENAGFFRYTGAELGAHKAYLVLDEEQAAGIGIRIVENVTAVENVKTADVVKFIENGVLYIQKNGRVYNAMGQLIK